MKQCNHCAHADWKRTANGRLHPDKTGRCTVVVKLPVLPQAFYWIGVPNASGGYIERGRELADHCAHFQRKEAQP